MSDILTRPGKNSTTGGHPPDPDSDSRAKLRDAITNLRDDKQRAEAIEAARERARRDGWAAHSRVQDAERQLQAARDDEPTRRAYAYLNNETAASPVEACEEHLAAAKAELDRISSIEAALDSELEQLQRRLQRRHVALHEAIANVVVASTALAQLFEALDQTWAKLRGLRKAFHLIENATHGQLPHALSAKWQASVSLNPEALYIATDETFATAWSAALEQLLEDANAPLPGSEQ